jgi:hypothetical protein
MREQIELCVYAAVILACIAYIFIEFVDEHDDEEAERRASQRVRRKENSDLRPGMPHRSAALPVQPINAPSQCSASRAADHRATQRTVDVNGRELAAPTGTLSSYPARSKKQQKNGASAPSAPVTPAAQPRRKRSMSESDLTSLVAFQRQASGCTPAAQPRRKRSMSESDLTSLVAFQRQASGCTVTSHDTGRHIRSPRVSGFKPERQHSRAADTTRASSGSRFYAHIVAGLLKTSQVAQSSSEISLPKSMSRKNTIRIGCTQSESDLADLRSLFVFQNRSPESSASSKPRGNAELMSPITLLMTSNVRRPIAARARTDRPVLYPQNVQ